MAETKTNETEDLERKERDRLTVKTLHNLLDRSKKDEQKRREEWDKHYNQYKGNYEDSGLWARFRRLGRRAKTRTNFLFSQIETIKPILTSETPSIVLRPIISSEVWRDIAEELTHMINRIYSRNNFHGRQVELVSNGLIFGHGFYKAVWDPDDFGGHGDVKIMVPDTRTIYKDAGNKDQRDVNFILEVQKVDMLTLLRMFPDRDYDIRKLFDKSGAPPLYPTGSSRERFRSDTIAAPEAAATTTTSRFFDAMGVDGHRNEIEFVEAWFHDYDMMEDVIELVDIKTGKKERKKVNRNRYEKGRLVQFAGNVVFVDKPNEFPCLPYVSYRNYYLPGEEYGWSDLKHTVPIQEQYDIRNNQLYDMLNFNMGPTRFYDSRSGLDPDLITNAPNQWVSVNDVNGIKTDPPPGVNNAMFTSLEKIKSELEAEFGVREVTQGTVPGDIRSGAAIEALQEAADVRLRGKSREMENSLRDLTRFIILLIVQFYEQGVHYRVSDKILKSQEWKFFKNKSLTGDFFEIEIRAGVNLPRSRVAKQQLLLSLHERGVIDDEFLVEHIQLEDREDLIKRMKPIYEMRHQALEQQAGGGNATGNTV